MNIALILQLVQLGAQFLNTTHAISPSPTTSSLADIANALIRAQNQNPIKWLQGALNAVLGSHIDVDGEIGPETEGAIQQLLSRFALSQQERDTISSAIKILISKAH
jgi:lysozyme family protein